MLARQPEIITRKIQPSSVLIDDIYGAFGAGQALSEVLYHSFNLCNQLWQRHYDCGRSAHRETVAYKGWVFFLLCCIWIMVVSRPRGDSYKTCSDVRVGQDIDGNSRSSLMTSLFSYQALLSDWTLLYSYLSKDLGNGVIKKLMCSEKFPLGIFWGWRCTCVQENHK